MPPLRYIVACVLLRIILTELDRKIAGLGWCVNADGLMRKASYQNGRVPHFKFRPGGVKIFRRIATALRDTVCVMTRMDGSADFSG